MGEKISVTRGLVKLKILSKQIEDKTHRLKIVTYSVGGKLSEIISKEGFKKSAQADFDSLIDLIKLRTRIKSAIVTSNSVTIVKIGEEKLPVAEAIERKISIASDIDLFDRLTSQFRNVMLKVEGENDLVEQKLNQIIETSFGGKEKRVEKSDYENIAVPYLAANERKLIDPLGVENILRKMSERIDNFQMNVDVALSESNAVTYIEV